MSPLSNTTCIDNGQLYCINRICDANFRCTETTLESCGLSNKVCYSTNTHTCTCTCTCISCAKARMQNTLMLYMLYSSV
jgi:hypothetical protein